MTTSLIDFKPLASVAEKVIDKISNAVSWYATHETPERIALNDYIKEIEQSNLPPLQKAAFITNAKKSIKEYSNQRNIIEESFQYLLTSAEPEKVDDDWLYLFMDKARLISNEDFQRMWGKILAEECNYPGKLSKQLLYIVSMMDRNDAITFTNICRFSSEIDCDDNDTRKYKYPLILNSNLDDYYSKYNITHDSLRTLESYGLIEGVQNLGVEKGYVLTTDNDIKSINYYKNKYKLNPNTRIIEHGDIIFKKPGRELCSMLDVEPVDDFWEKIALPYFKDKNPV